jgi:hypothetical protein
VRFEAVQRYDLLSAVNEEAKHLLPSLEHGIGAMIQCHQGRFYNTASKYTNLADVNGFLGSG